MKAALAFLLKTTKKIMEEAKKIIKAINRNKPQNKPTKEASDEAMEKLANVMTNAPTLVKLANSGWEITALKPAVQWLIAKEACDIKKVENATFGDILGNLAMNIPSVARIITLALLNDKERIEKEYQSVYDTIMWEGSPSEWANLLYEVLKMQDIEFFFASTQMIDEIRKMTLQRKKMTEELK